MSGVRPWDKFVRCEGLLIVVSGPSGVGKDAVLAELAKIYPRARKCVTTTTREPRDGEAQGVDYTFVSEEEFRERIESGGFLEHAEFCGNLYGTPRQWVEDRLGEGVDVVLKIDVQGGLAVKRQMPSALMIFLVPPSMEELERRLRNRLTDSEEAIAGRLVRARRELEQIPHYDYIVENDDVVQAAEELKAVIIAEHCRVRS
ncbi:MAG: guanylate kinase [Armatimonadetes bacterium]|nr:guanylate kinase [Armatimonadota bacterium]